MPKTTAEKIALKRKQIKQFQNEEKQLIQKQKKEERAARTRRLCSRHGLLEKFMPELATITDEQFEVFIKTGIDTTYGRNKLAEIKAKAGATATPQTAKTPTQNNGNPNTKQAESAPQTQAAEPKKSGGGATVEG